MRSDVAVLFVDPRGPYPKLVEQWFDADRDARTYAGSLPVVAHPPCGPWGKMARFCDKQDPDLAPLAVDFVRRFGGVLEHPAGSRLWERCDMPKPGELPDFAGGRTLEVCQVDWGHVARKRTWLYVVGRAELPPFPGHREPTHWVRGNRRRGAGMRGGLVPEGIKVCSPQQRRRTPVAFAEWLLEVAASVRLRRAAA